MTESDDAGSDLLSGAQAILASFVRTLVPLLVGWVVAAGTKIGVPIEESDALLVANGLVSIAVAALYYGAARLLEVFASSKWGWLLGFAKAPLYQAPKP